MVRKLMISGLVGIAAGLGFGMDTDREAREACHQGALSSAVDSYHLRTLGRWEEHLTGTENTAGGAFDRSAARASGSAQTAYPEAYQLRLLGRAEAWEPERILPETALNHTPPAASAYEAASRDQYRLRTEGRWEAHDAGSDYCGLEPIGAADRL
ncbi:MAG TPA: hypothetical protein VJ385_05695 [Fibrobacteria bacterium]|nr:hypothetical protein [Fibrobacteria bacterium]